MNHYVNFLTFYFSKSLLYRILIAILVSKNVKLSANHIWHFFYGNLTNYFFFDFEKRMKRLLLPKKNKSLKYHYKIKGKK